MTMTLTYAPEAYKLLRGILAVYKPSDTSINALLDGFGEKILLDLNKLKQRPQKQMILFKPVSVLQLQSSDDKVSSRSSGKVNVPTLVPDWFDHPLVQGARYTRDDLTIHVGHTLDSFSCGVQLIGLQKAGEVMIKKLRLAALPRHYRVRGRFGTATRSYTNSPDSEVVERATWDHITAEMIDRVLCVMLGAHRNACMLASGVDLSSHKAYVLAAKGLLKPRVPTEAIILDLKLTAFKAPDFQLDVSCMNESCEFLRRVIHDVGYELKSAAVCTHLQRRVDAVFTHTDKHTLLLHQVNANNVVAATRHCRHLLQQNFVKWKPYFSRGTINTEEERLKIESDNKIKDGETDENFSKITNG